MTRQLWKQPPYQHQEAALAFAHQRDCYALLMEQGTGKTPVLINDAARRFEAGRVDCLLALAPAGVHDNWILREIPKHLPDWVQHRSAAWYAGPTKAERERLASVMAPDNGSVLRILAMNWEALTTVDGLTAALAFLRSKRRGTFTAADESQRVKNPGAIRTKKLLRFIKPLSDVRTIASGTAILNSPWDAFSQFGFMSEQILRIQSYVAFKAEYAELLPTAHGLMRHITMRIRPAIEARLRPFVESRYTPSVVRQLREEICAMPDAAVWLARGVMFFEQQVADAVKARIDAALKIEVDEEVARRSPQIVKRNAEGLPMWRNLEKLEALIAPYAFRILKKDCLDLPEKVYTQRFFRMTGRQKQAYKLLLKDLRLQLQDGTILPIQRIASITKLSQIVSGYFAVPGMQNVVDPAAKLQRLVPPQDNPKLLALWDALEDCLDAGEQVIIWARFHVEIEDIAEMLRAHDVASVQYHGDVNRGGRQQSIDAFERGEARVLIGQQAAGGTGITLIAPHSVVGSMSVIYYSNTWSLEDRVQSEDRAHRIGQEKTVRYVDLMVEKTIDERIVNALRAKVDLASTVLGDKRRALELLEEAA